MGLFDLFRSRRERESAVPGGMSSAESGSVDLTEADGLGALGDAIGQALNGGDANVTMESQVINLQGQGDELRNSILDTLKTHGIDAEKGQSVQIADPAVAQDIFAALSKHGLNPAFMGVDAATYDAIPATAPSLAAGDTITQLERLGKLQEDGVLTAAEFEEQKRKIIGE